MSHVDIDDLTYKGGHPIIGHGEANGVPTVTIMLVDFREKKTLATVTLVGREEIDGFWEGMRVTMLDLAGPSGWGPAPRR